MQTRRRLQQHEYTTTGLIHLESSSIPVISSQQQQQQQHLLIPQTYEKQNYTNPLFVTAPAVNGQLNHITTPKLNGGSGVNSAETVIITDDIDDNKYTKSTGRQWNLRSLSTRLQASSGQALRTYIQQPLTAAAAVVIGNYDNSSESDQQQIQQQPLLAYRNEDITNDIDDEKDEEDSIFDKDNIIVMASRDRTNEFSNAIRSLQSRNITRAVNIRDPRKAKQVQSYSEFMMIAKYIGKNIGSTYAKLEKLTLLAKRKTLFDDRPQEIQELTYIIKGDLNALNQQIAKLQDISKDQRRTVNGKHLVSHSSNMVLALQSKLASMSTDFKQILEVRTENLKHQKQRREIFGQTPQMTNERLALATAKTGGSLLLSEENQAVSIDMSGSDTSSLLGPPARLQVQQQIGIYDESDNYVHQRAETMQNIESTIVELGGIFQQLAHMVKEQEEIVERIDTNVQDAEMNIESAHGEILKYFQSVSKNRWLMIKIFGVLIFFFIFFVVFLT